MKRTLLIIVFIALIISLFTHPTFGLDSESIVRLKNSGVSDHTIELIIKEKVVETAAFTVQEILDMKKAGLSEKTIQMVIKEGSFLKDTAPIIYGKDVRSIQFTTAQDIIELKKAGLSDDVIQAIIYVVGESDISERQYALDLLEGMGIRIDLRGGD
jgi:hypothetical protein